MYLALRGGPRGFTRTFPDSVLLGNTTWRSMTFAYGALTLCGARFHNASARYRLVDSMRALSHSRVGPTTPMQHRRQAVPLHRFRLVPFRSPLLGESRLFSLPRGTEMFQFPRFPPPALCVQAGVTGHDPSRVSPFGNPRIKACLRLPEAYRSLPRPSSPLCAKASTVYP